MKVAHFLGVGRETRHLITGPDSSEPYETIAPRALGVRGQVQTFYFRCLCGEWTIRCGTARGQVWKSHLEFRVHPTVAWRSSRSVGNKGGASIEYDGVAFGLDRFAATA